MNFSLIQNLRSFVIGITVNLTKAETKISGGRALRWNSPVILMFAVVVFIVHLASQTSYGYPIEKAFSATRPESWGNVANLANFFLYVFYDNGRWSNIASSMMLIVLLGPIVEERIGSLQLAAIMAVTAFGIGALHALLFTQKLYGPTSIAYLLVFLASFVNVKKKEIPASFVVVLIILFFVGAEQWSQQFRDAFPMIMGGICGIFWAPLVRKVVQQ